MINVIKTNDKNNMGIEKKWDNKLDMEELIYPVCYIWLWKNMMSSKSSIHSLCFSVAEDFQNNFLWSLKIFQKSAKCALGSVSTIRKKV